MAEEVICLHVGQAGIQIGNACWEQFCLEHQIEYDGKLAKPLSTENKYIKSFFNEDIKGKFEPRSIFVDLDPTLIDEVRTGKLKQLFNPNLMIKGKEDSSNNFAKGQQSKGPEILELTLEKLRTMAEKCDSLQGFLGFNSCSGGTGSGFGSLLYEKLSTEFDKKQHFVFPIFPSQNKFTSPVEPQNCILQLHKTSEKTNLNFMFDNEALYELCSRNLEIEKPSQTNINRLISQVVSSITCSLRFNDDSHVNLNEFQINLTNYPQMNWVFSSLAPIVTKEKAIKEKFTVQDITNAAYQPESMMIICDPRNGKQIGCTLLQRGDIKAQDVFAAISSCFVGNRNFQLVHSTSRGFKVGINSKAPVCFPGDFLANFSRSLCMVTNSTAIAAVFERYNQKFDLIFNKRAWVHYYVSEGMEEQEFSEASERIYSHNRDYVYYKYFFNENIKKVDIGEEGGDPDENIEDEEAGVK